MRGAGGRGRGGAGGCWIWIRSGTGCCLLWYPGGGHGHGVEFRGAGEERDRYRAGRGRGGKIVRVKNKMRKETKKSLGSRSVSRAQTAKCSPRLINSFSPPAHRTRRGRSGVCILLVIPRGPAFYRAPSQLSVACAFRSELRSHAKEGGWEAPRKRVRSSFRNLTAARSSLGLAAELLGSPLGRSAARKPAEYKTGCWPCE